ncbi:hypothetical protein [Aphanothece stagnina]|uniref:hypothetical protein n=1 Tax=Aphanothece stagnina TaxID=1004305 RepID=UPI00398E971C
MIESYEIGYLCAGEAQKMLAYMAHEGMCFILDIDSGTVTGKFQTSYHVNDHRVYLDDGAGVLYRACYSTRQLDMYDVFTGKHFNSVRTNRRIDFFVRVHDSQLAVWSSPSVLFGDTRTGQLKRKFSGYPPQGVGRQYPPFIFMQDLNEKPFFERPFLVDENLNRIGKVISANYRGAAYVCDGKGLAWTYNAGTTFYELDFVRGTTREVFSIEQKAEWTFPMYDDLRRIVSVISINRAVDIIHVDVDIDTYKPVVRRRGLQVQYDSCYIKRLHRLYQANGLVYDLTTAEYLEPIDLTM